MGVKQPKRVKKARVNQKKKFYWTIKWTKRNIVHVVFFGFFALQLIACVIGAIIIDVKYGFTSNNNFLILWLIICLIIDFFIARRVLLNSQPED